MNATYLAAIVVLATWSPAQDEARGSAVPADWDDIVRDEARLEAYRCPVPREFASVFSFGYAGDHMPKDDAQFAAFLETIADLGFNVVHTTHTPRRLEQCREHGIRLMVDLLAPEHQAHPFHDEFDGKAEALVRSLRDEPTVWGYNIWNDPWGDAGGKVRSLINTVRRWDPTHPAFAGTYHWPAARTLTNADVQGYYDYHWERGIHYHAANCRAYWESSRANDCRFYTWLSTDPGATSEERVHRSLWSANIGIAFGLKGILWFLGTDYVDRETLAVRPKAEEIRRIHRELMPLRTEVARLGPPSAVYGTPVTRDMNDRPVEGAPIAAECAPFPDDFWMRPVAGELIVGVFDEGEGARSLFVVNYNARAPQDVELELAAPCRVSVFDRERGEWSAPQDEASVVRIALSPGAGELLRFE